MSPGREAAGSLQRGNPDMSEWMQDDWGTKTREKCGRQFTLPTFAPFLFCNLLLHSFVGQNYLKKNKGEEEVWPEHSIFSGFLV